MQCPRVGEASWLAVAVFVALVATGCSTSGNSRTNAVQEAKLACKTFLPPVVSHVPGTTATFQRAFRLAHVASEHAAKAASLDSRWNRLNQAESDMLNLWEYVVEELPGVTAETITPAQLTEYNQLRTTYDSAARIARAECAKADAS